MARKLIVVNPDASPEEMMKALEEALEELREEETGGDEVDGRPADGGGAE